MWCLQLLCYWPIFFFFFFLQMRDLLSTARSWRPGCSSSSAQQSTAQVWNCHMGHEPFDVKPSSSEDRCNVSLKHKFYLHLWKKFWVIFVSFCLEENYTFREECIFYSANNVSKSHYLIVCVKIKGISSNPNQKTESSVLALPLGTVKRDSHPLSVLRWLMYNK